MTVSQWVPWLGPVTVTVTTCYGPCDDPSDASRDITQTRDVWWVKGLTLGVSGDWPKLSSIMLCYVACGSRHSNTQIHDLIARRRGWCKARGLMWPERGGELKTKNKTWAVDTDRNPFPRSRHVDDGVVTSDGTGGLTPERVGCRVVRQQIKRYRMRHINATQADKSAVSPIPR